MKVLGWIFWFAVAGALFGAVAGRQLDIEAAGHGLHAGQRGE